MKKESAKAMLVLLGAILFNLIFWNEKLGVNTVLFALFITGCIVFLYPGSLKKNSIKWLIVANMITISMLVINNTFLSKMAFSVTILLFISFSQYRHRSAFYAGGSAVLNYVFAIPNLLKQIKIVNDRKIKTTVLIQPLMTLLAPLLIVSVFIVIYSFANIVFSNITSQVATIISNWVAYIFNWLSIDRLWFFLLGLFVTCGLILSVKNNWLSKADMKKTDSLNRKKNNFKKWRESALSDLLSVITSKPSAGILALKNEFAIGFISLALLNLLLLFINLIDIKYVWMDFTFNDDLHMATYVHEGAGLLILSIVLAMLLLLFFFRGNLNFYKKSVTLKYGAYLWIFQNLFLVISVFIRDYYYISHFGLAYKRIGLLFFLAMVLAGLFTVFLKIYSTKTIYYLIRINAWAIIFLLVVSTVINWDETIAGYNLARKSSIPVDVHFLLSLSNKTLPLIERNRDVLQNKTEGRMTALDFFESRKRIFFEEQKNYSWLSWNAADASVIKALKLLPAISSLK